MSSKRWLAEWRDGQEKRAIYHCAFSARNIPPARRSAAKARPPAVPLRCTADRLAATAPQEKSSTPRLRHRAPPSL